MCPLVPTLNCVKLKDYLLVPVTIHTISMVLFIPTKTVGTHAATCDRVVLVLVCLSFVLKLWRLWGQVAVAMGASGGGYGATDKPTPRCFLPKHKN